MEISDKIQSLLKNISSNEVGYVLILFFATRPILILIGLASRRLLAPYMPEVFDEYILHYSDISFLNLWGMWDSGWYLQIAEHGYSPKLGTIDRELNMANYAFFPVLPIFIRIVGTVIRNYFVAGLLITNICLIVSGVYLYKLVRLDYEDIVGFNAVKFLFIFPNAYMFSSVLTEPVFLMLTLMIFYYGRKQKWLLIGVLGFFLSLTRVLGAFIALPILIEYLKVRDYRLSKIKLNVLYIAIIPLGLAVYIFYNYFLTRDPLAFVHIQAAWGREISSPNPIIALYEGLTGSGYYYKLSALIALLVLTALVIFYRRFRFSYWVYTLYSILIPISTGLLSVHRFVLILFPFYILFGLLYKRPKLDLATTIAMALLQGFSMALWSVGLL